MTQTEALSYAWHLAEVTGQNEPQPDRARALAGMSDDMKNLYYEVFGLLLSKTHSAPTNSIGSNLISRFTNRLEHDGENTLCRWRRFALP